MDLVTGGENYGREVKAKRGLILVNVSESKRSERK